MNYSKTLMAICFGAMTALLFAGSVHAQNRASFDANKFYRISNQWQGPSKSLDIVNDGRNNRVALAKTGNYTGQYWKIIPNGDGSFRLYTQWQGPGKSLDVLNEGSKNQIMLANSGEYSGQVWYIKPAGDGYYRLTTLWQGPDRSLDVVHSGNNNAVQLARTGDYSGQYWKITEIPSKTTLESGPTALVLKAGQTMRRGSAVTCPNKDFALKFQRDGNLVFYGPRNTYIWDARTAGKGETCTLQRDGNLVVYDSRKIPVWSSETMGYFDKKFSSRSWKPAKLEISDKGVCALKSATGNIGWVCGEDPAFKLVPRLGAGQSLTKGSGLSSPDRSYTLKFQKDGYLVLYGPNKSYTWHADAAGAGETCILQKDGNLVIYDKYRKPIWSSETMGYFDRKYSSKEWKPVKLEVRNTGVAALVSATGKVGWTCGGTTTTTTMLRRLTAGQTLERGNGVSSRDGNYILLFQPDGNLAFYGPDDRQIWEAGTAHEGETCVLQHDGNLVIYDRDGRPAWSSETMGYFDRKFSLREWKPVRLEINNAGTCALLSATNKIAWSIGNDNAYRFMKRLSAGQRLAKGTGVASPDGRYYLKFQKDGNLAFYSANDTYIWDAETQGKGETCVLQNDGNLVIYDITNNPVWSSKTMGYFDSKYASRDWKPVRLEVSNSGACALISATGRVAWNCGYK